jgi:hypothetical protein
MIWHFPTEPFSAKYLQQYHLQMLILSKGRYRPFIAIFTCQRQNAPDWVWYYSKLFLLLPCHYYHYATGHDIFAILLTHSNEYDELFRAFSAYILQSFQADRRLRLHRKNAIDALHSKRKCPLPNLSRVLSEALYCAPNVLQICIVSISPIV